MNVLEQNNNPQTPVVVVEIGCNSVAQSDYDAAIRAMEATFSDALKNDDPVTRRLIQDAQISMIQKFQQMVEPVTDKDYQDWLNLFHVGEVDDDDDDDSDSDDDSNQDGCDEEFDDVSDSDCEEEEEIDEEDLLDVKALQEAKELRSTVRSMALRVQKIRSRVLERASSLAVPSSLVTQNDNSVRLEGPVVDAAETTAALQESLIGLSKLLQDPQWTRLPRQLQSLQQTIEVIENESQRPLSQTEVAIVSRTNYGTTENEEEALWPTTVPDEVLSGPDRLARFFQDLE